jgi:hypothetical protein
LSRVPDADFGLRRDPTGSALPTVPQIRFTQGTYFVASLVRFPLRPVRLLAPLHGSDRVSPASEGFYIQASDESASLPAAGYDYNSKEFWQGGAFFSFVSFFVRSEGARFFVPTRTPLTSARAGAVKVGRRANLAGMLHPCQATPCMGPWKSSREFTACYFFLQPNFFVRLESPFLRPDPHRPNAVARRGLSRLAVAQISPHAPAMPGHTLTAPSTAARSLWSG